MTIWEEMASNDGYDPEEDVLLNLSLGRLKTSGDVGLLMNAKRVIVYCVVLKRQRATEGVYPEPDVDDDDF